MPRPPVASTEPTQREAAGMQPSQAIGGRHMATSSSSAATAIPAGFTLQQQRYMPTIPEAVLLSQERCRLFLYLDYNGVLNSESHHWVQCLTQQRQLMLASICKFMVQVDHIPYKLHTTLLSKSSGETRRLITLGELFDAGVLDLFDRIVFTSDRTSDTNICTYTEQLSYQDARLGTTAYELFSGGKDQFIHSQHVYGSDESILFVDDKACTVQAVCEATPAAHGIEMRRHCFFTDPSVHVHVRNLNELYDAIVLWAAAATREDNTDVPALEPAPEH